MSAPPNDNRRAYVSRINRVIDYIGQHLSDTLDLQTLADVAHFSPWHFHRVFQGIAGETLADCVRRLRLEAAANQLLASPPLPALQVAMNVGFASAEVFSRAFRAQFGMTPTAWRRGGWRDRAAQQHDEWRKINQEQHKANQDIDLLLFKDRTLWPVGPITTPEGVSMQVEIKNVPPLRLAYMRRIGAYGQLGIAQLWQRFAPWCAAHGLMNPRRKMYGICHDNPEITPPDKCRYDACIEVDEGFRPPAGDEVGIQNFTGGRYACARFTGKAGADVHQAWNYLMDEWLPNSGYEADNNPAIEIYEEDFVMDADTGIFSCLLCMPVKPL